MKEDYKEEENEQEEGIDFRELLFKYFINWKWFVISIVACIAVAWLYLHITSPTYEVNATVLIKEDSKNGKSGNSAFAGLEDLGLFSNSSNFDNEVEIMKSRTLVQKVVEDKSLYVSYYIRSGLRSDEIYNEAPVLVYMTPAEASKLKEAAKVEITTVNSGIMVEAEINGEKYNKSIDKLPGLISTPHGTISFMKNKHQIKCDDVIESFKAVIVDPAGVTNDYVNGLTIEPTSKTTTIAAITFKCKNKEKGVEFINSLVDQYNMFTNDDKNEVATKTADFINERVKIINDELGSTEQQLESFKRSSGLTDVKSDAQLAMTQNSEYEKKRVENATQIRILEFLSEYANSSANKWEVLPVNVGLTDNSLSTLISNYNEMLLERKRLLHTSSENNPAVVNLDMSIHSMHNSVITTIASVYKGLLITKKDLDMEAGRFQSKINEAPGQEREFVSISRQQEIKAGLYLMLLQKREENAITLASVANNAHVVDRAEGSLYPISPKKSIVYLIGLVLGIAIPMGIIYVIDLLKYKIESRDDIQKITDASIIGDIPVATTTPEHGSVVVKENQNDMMAETFRNIRTNIIYMLEKNENVIMFTSSNTGEGKSFVVANTALSFALMGKKTIAVGLDIRKPGLNHAFNLRNHAKGISDYLGNPDNTDLDSLIIQSDYCKNLYILAGGTIPPNPTELISRQIFKDVIEKLRKEFDYVILDTAPIAIVTDTQIISEVADVSVYICRANFTTKAEYSFINYLMKEKKMKKICTLINGIDVNDKKYGYSYGYGKYGSYGRRYGYGYGKSYGYGYGYGSNNEKKENQK